MRAMGPPFPLGRDSAICPPLNHLSGKLSTEPRLQNDISSNARKGRRSWRLEIRGWRHSPSALRKRESGISRLALLPLTSPPATHYCEPRQRRIR